MYGVKGSCHENRENLDASFSSRDSGTAKINTQPTRVDFLVGCHSVSKTHYQITKEVWAP